VLSLSVPSPLRTRLLRPLGLALLTAALLPAGSAASTYGRLVARHAAAPASMLDTQFNHARRAGSFLLVVTEPTKAELQFKWSLHCYDAARKASGGASGEVTVSSGHWVKRVRANWIKHPAYCAGGIVGSAAGSPVLVRIFAR
jgi:hypothetical protein